MASEDFRLPIQRQMIGVFAGQHVGQEAGTRHAALDRAWRRRCLNDRVTTGAREFWSHDANDFEAYGLEFEHFRDVVAKVL